jgi:hypothetical protein
MGQREQCNTHPTERKQWQRAEREKRNSGVCSPVCEETTTAERREENYSGIDLNGILVCFDFISFHPAVRRLPLAQWELANNGPMLFPSSFAFFFLSVKGIIGSVT